MVMEELIRQFVEEFPAALDIRGNENCQFIRTFG